MLDRIIQIDEKLLLLINGIHNPWLDSLMLTLSDRWVWIPLYLYLIYAILKVWKFKVGTIALLTATALLSLSDFISSGLFKPLVGRLRPCYQEHLIPKIHFILDSCGGQFGFFSSHASDTFTISTFIFLIFRKSKYTYLLLLWAFAVSISRVYLAKHFPLDIVAGAVCGIILGYLGASLFKYIHLRIVTTNKV